MVTFSRTFMNNLIRRNLFTSNLEVNLADYKPFFNPKFFEEINHNALLKTKLEASVKQYFANLPEFCYIYPHLTNSDKSIIKKTLLANPELIKDRRSLIFDITDDKVGESVLEADMFINALDLDKKIEDNQSFPAFTEAIFYNVEHRINRGDIFTQVSPKNIANQFMTIIPPQQGIANCLYMASNVYIQKVFKESRGEYNWSLKAREIMDYSLNQGDYFYPKSQITYKIINQLALECIKQQDAPPQADSKDNINKSKDVELTNPLELSAKQVIVKQPSDKVFRGF